MRRRVADHLRVVLDVRERGEPGPAVADDGAARGDVAGDEGVERGGRIVPDHVSRTRPGPLPTISTVPRSGSLSSRRAAGLGRDRVVLGCEREAGLVHLRRARQRSRRTPRSPGAAAEQQPGGPVGAEPEPERQPPGRDPVLVRRDQRRRQDPELEPTSPRCSTVPAVTEVWGRHRAHSTSSVPRPSPSPWRCPQPGQRNRRASASRTAAGAGLIVGKPRLELRQRARPLNHRHLPPRPARPQPVAMPVSTG